MQKWVRRMRGLNISWADMVWEKEMKMDNF